MTVCGSGARYAATMSPVNVAWHGASYPHVHVVCLQGGWLCSQLACDVPFGDNPLMPRRNTASWFAVGRATALARQVPMDPFRMVLRLDCRASRAHQLDFDSRQQKWAETGIRMTSVVILKQAHMLVEYDAATRAPIGLVCRDLGASALAWRFLRTLSRCSAHQSQMCVCALHLTSPPLPRVCRRLTHSPTPARARRFGNAPCRSDCSSPLHQSRADMTISLRPSMYARSFAI